MKAIVSFISMLIDYVATFFESMITFVSLMFKSITALPTYFHYISGTLVIMVVIIVTIAVSARLLGRE